MFRDGYNTSHTKHGSRWGSGPRRLVLRCWLLAVRAARAVARVAAECHRAQRRVSQLHLHPEAFTGDRDRAPGTYAEFLFRCPAALVHEPSARERVTSRPKAA